MSAQGSAAIPPPSAITFQGGINHPELWLWDSWTLRQDNRLHLYCLALNRVAADDTPIEPNDRNQFAFHIRHFVSGNDARTWTDRGCVMQPGASQDGSDQRNIWSGSVAELADGRTLYAYTGIREAARQRTFLQSICLGIGPSPDTQEDVFEQALSDPERDYEAIRAAGYYLGPQASLGQDDGEEGGPILAWRDPYVFIDSDAMIHLFWSAKAGPKTPAVAHATLRQDGTRFVLDQLHPPILLPDSQALTQAEVPKIYHDEKRGLYYLLIAACNRLYEGQPDHEVSKQHRLYKSTSLDGPWQLNRRETSLLPELSGLFGASIIDTDFETGDFRFLGPYTEMAPPAQQLSFSGARVINIYRALENEIEKTA